MIRYAPYPISVSRACGSVRKHVNTSPPEQKLFRAPSRGISTYLLIAGAMSGLICLYFVIKRQAFAFVDIGSDTFFCFYPLQLAVARQLQSLHTLTWSFDLGLGGYLGTLFDPLWLVTGWLPFDWQLALRLPMYALRIVLAGLFFHLYLRRIGFAPRLATLGALGYAFSSYAMINAQWEVIHGTEFVQFAAYLWLFEAYVRGRRPLAAVVAGVVVGIGNPFGLWTFALFTLVYGCARLSASPRGERREFVRRFVAFGSWSVCGLVLTAPLLLPALYYFLDSPRVSGTHSALWAILQQSLHLNSALVIGSEVAGFLGKNLLGATDVYHGWANWFEGPGFYVGLLPLLLVPQLLGPNATTRERWLCIASLAGISLYVVWPALRFAVYGFGHPGFRFSTLWISALLLVLGLAGLRRAWSTGVWRPGLALGAAGILAIPAALLIAAPQAVSVAQVIRIVAFTAIYAVFFLWSARKGTFDPRHAKALLLVFACELALFAMPSLLGRTAVGVDGDSPVGRYDDGTDAALALVRTQRDAGDFFRVTKSYQSVFLDDALVQDYPGIDSYYFHGRSLTRFVDKMNVKRALPSSNYIGHVTARQGLFDFLGVRYELARHRALDGNPDLNWIGTADGIQVYRNLGAQPFGQLRTQIASEAEASALPVPRRDALLLEKVIAEDPGELASLLTRAASLDRGAPRSMPAVHIAKLRDDRLAGTVNAPDPSVLVLTMPFDRGWSALLDDQPLDLFRCDFGLTCGVVTRGPHAIALAYSPPGRKIGWVLATVTLVGLGGFAAWRRHRYRSL